MSNVGLTQLQHILKCHPIYHSIGSCMVFENLIKLSAEEC